MKHALPPLPYGSAALEPHIGACVVMRASSPDYGLGDLPWMLLGVHSARLDVSGRDLDSDEALGLNCAWYADILLLTLTESRK